MFLRKNFETPTSELHPKVQGFKLTSESLLWSLGSGIYQSVLNPRSFGLLWNPRIPKGNPWLVGSCNPKLNPWIHGLFGIRESTEAIQGFLGLSRQKKIPILHFLGFRILAQSANPWVWIWLTWVEKIHGFKKSVQPWWVLIFCN